MKKISLLLVLVMLFSLLTGCTHDDTNGVVSDNQLPDSGSQEIPDNDNKGNDINLPDDGNGDETDNEIDISPEETPENPPENGEENGDEKVDDSVSAEIGTAVGNLMASINIQTLDGETISVEDYRGKVVVFNLWATWCGPCTNELPEFNKVATEYKDDVVIIAVHITTGNAYAQSYVNTYFPETDIIFAYDTEGNDAYYAAGGIGYVPHTAILDKNGVIVYTDSGALSESQLIALIESAK